jgi:putative sporulation protein YyaC
MAPTGILMAMQCFFDNELPIILCVGSDLVIGDCLGPITGSMLKEKMKNKSVFVYGDLVHPVTAKEVKYLNEFISKVHPNKKVLVIDAAIGDEGDIGTIKIKNKGLCPGQGTNKKLDFVGNVSIMGIVAEKSVFNYSLMNLTRLNMVYIMADIMSNAVKSLAENTQNSLFNRLNSEKLSFLPVERPRSGSS